jgi:glyoxylase I family protein
MIKGIEHTAIASSNPAALAQWYEDTLGFVINYRGKTAFFVKAPDGTMLEIITAEGDAGPNSMKTPGLRHLALTTEGFEAEYERLKSLNVTFLTEAEVRSGNKVVFFSDPDGNILHLIERGTPMA